ncbi:MAG: Holliday junction resolvase RuvX [Patescibacteria group bacterium]|jgi:putative Holliday junction resolvase
MQEELKIYLGVDWGEKRIGLALGDSETKVATPFKTVSSAKEVAEVIYEEIIDVLVLGEPIKMRGEDNGLNKDFLIFLEELKKLLPNIKIELIDERLSSQEADKMPGNKKTKASRDEISAMIILQNYLDKNGTNF